LERFGAGHGIQIEIRTKAFTDKAHDYLVEGDAAASDAMQKYQILWMEEWSRYPKSLMAKAKVERIIFCEKLSLNGQARAAVPAFDINSMYYDPAVGAKSPLYQRSVIHHEFFHMLDHRMGTVVRDPEWCALNAVGFNYGSGGKTMRTNGVGNLTAEIPGFLTVYGTSAVEEDKAELYAHLIVSPRFANDQALKDPVLAAKIALLKKRLQEYSPCFDSDFWPKPSS
jgi:hypothetical protein